MLIAGQRVIEFKSKQLPGRKSIEIFYDDLRLSSYSIYTMPESGDEYHSIEWFLKYYQRCSLEKFLYLQLNPSSDYYRIFYKSYFKPKDPIQANPMQTPSPLNFSTQKKSDERGMRLQSKSIQDNLKNILKGLVRSGVSDPCFQNPDIRQALHELTNLRFDPDLELHVMRLVHRSYPPSEQAEPSDFVLKASPIVTFLLFETLNIDLKYRVAGFLDLLDPLKYLLPSDCMQCHDPDRENNGLRCLLNRLIRIFRYVIPSEHPVRQVKLLHQIFLLWSNATHSSIQHSRILLRFIHSNESIQENQEPIVFFMKSIRILCGLSTTDYPNDHSFVTAQTHQLQKLWENIRHSSKKIDHLVAFAKKCTELLGSIRKYSDAAQSMILCFAMGLLDKTNRTAQIDHRMTYVQSLFNDTQAFMRQWLHDVDETQKAALFNQWVVRLLAKQFFPTVSLKDDWKSSSKGLGPAWDLENLETNTSFPVLETLKKISFASEQEAAVQNDPNFTNPHACKKSSDLGMNAPA